MQRRDYSHFRKDSWAEGRLTPRGIISPCRPESAFFKAEYETKWLVKWDLVWECEAAVAACVSNSGSWNAALGCEECWYVAATNIQSHWAADPLWNLCVCVWRLSTSSVRQPLVILITAPRMHTNINTSQENREQQKKISRRSQPVLEWEAQSSGRKRASRFGCRAAGGAFGDKTRPPGPSPRRNNVLYSDPLTREGEQRYIFTYMQLAL